MQGWLARVTPAEKMNHQDRATLLASLQGSERGDRWRAAEALGEADPGREGIAALAAVLSSADPILCWEAAHALAQIGTPAAETALLEAVAAGNVAAQVAAIDALGALPARPESLAALLSALESDRAGVRQSAAEAVARLSAQPAADGAPAPGAETVSVLVGLLQTDDAPLVRRAAALALGRIGDPEARDALEAAAGEPGADPVVRQAAEEALTRLHQPEPAIKTASAVESAETPAESI